ncbi:hypothetical protein P7M32_06130 [Bisgaard Taxon 10/6]|uniref:Uncharacterized protein n=1 Tax=Exercitatus varius TaxID=67857 RepID=A0ABT6ESR7_9PAST|nr:hypothetical protein [Exercitatus varius]MDG2938792.1 hypothetical protein [Exercitatus varius]MDG2946006.1 hypothetical protein [Exercitatus varius]MDG2947826.1 hypothetical protein [Exercitatus varius]MDG2953528.1 hypothetical protein [Exercitatus varius]MDG2955474.1 hypothetical protein [Exercitatus varius]
MTAKFDLSDVEFHSFHWDNFNRDVLNAHKKVMAHFGLNVIYTEENMEHGEWLDRVMSRATKNVVAIIEPDCIPLNREIIEQSAEFVYKNNTFLGPAQASNHIYPGSHIFASPAFFFMATDCYKRMGFPSFKLNDRSDVAEEVAYRAEKLGVPYRALYPTHYEREPLEGIWRLGNYGYYGIGTVFAGSIYHLFQSRFEQNVKLFLQHCDEVINDRFSLDAFRCSTVLSPPERQMPLPKPKPLVKRIRKRLKRGLYTKNKFI